MEIGGRKLTAAEIFSCLCAIATVFHSSYYLGRQIVTTDDLEKTKEEIIKNPAGAFDLPTVSCYNQLVMHFSLGIFKL